MRALFGHFDAKQLCNACLVCRRWRRIADSHPQWCMLLKHLGVTVQVPTSDVRGADACVVGARVHAQTIMIPTTTVSIPRRRTWRRATSSP